MDEVLEWVARIVKFIPVFQKLWSAVADHDQGALLAAQMEMVTKIREQQAIAAFQLDDPDDVTSPGGGE